MTTHHGEQGVSRKYSDVRRRVFPTRTKPSAQICTFADSSRCRVRSCLPDFGAGLARISYIRYFAEERSAFKLIAFAGYQPMAV